MYKTPIALAIASALLTTYTLPAIAADDEKEVDKSKLEVIQVTATKHVTNLMETPLAVTAMTPESMNRQNIKSVGDLSGMIPNLQFGTSNSDSGVKATIRGVSSTNFTEIGDPAVGIHIDGIYSPRPQGSLALMFDLEQVEVLRGAQGTLFGRNSTAGVINIIPAKPVFDDNFGWTTVQLGNYNAKQVRSVYNFSLADNFALRGAIMLDQRDGYINQQQDLTDRGWNFDDNGTYVPTPDGKPDIDMRLNNKVDKSDYYSNSDQWGARLTGLWQITDNLAWTVGYEHFQNNGAGDVSLQDCEANEGTQYACATDKHFDQEVLINVPGKLDMSIDTIRSLVSYDINSNTTIEHRFSYANQQRTQHHDDDGGQHPVNSEVKPGSWWQEVYVDDRATYTLDSEYQSYVNELQLKQTFDNWQYVVGGFWMYEDNTITFAQETLVKEPYGYPIGQYYDQPKREIDSKAIFAQADVDLTDRLTVTVGARYTQDKRIDNNGETWGDWNTESDQYYNDQHTPLGTDISHNGTDLTFGMGAFAGKTAYPGPTVNTYEKDWDKTTWRLGAQYDLGDKQMIFASVATGYRAGGFGDKTDTCGGGTCVGGDPNTPVYSFLDYDPETTTNFEVGYKGSLLEDTLNFTAIAFFTQYEDMHYTGMNNVGNVERADNPACSWDADCNAVEAWTTENIGNSDIMGLELEFDYIPWENGQLTGFYAFLHTEITEYDTYNDNWMCGGREQFGAEPCAPIVNTPETPEFNGRAILDVTGNQLPNSPEHSFGFNYSHYIELGEYQLMPWVGVRWQDKMYFTPRNLDNKVVGDYQDAYTNVNATLKFGPVDESWYVELYGNNLTDEVVKNWMGQGNQGDFTSNSYNPPRMYGIRFNLAY
jgi:iron complex outermembrane receptor protein